MGLSTVFKRLTGRQVTGQAGESRALTHLQTHGLLLRERNFSCKGGEIDLVMQERDTLVFVEVRTRARSSYGDAASSVTAAKQRRLIVAAHTYLRRYRMPPPCRFDVIAIDDADLTWIRNAIEG